MPSLPSRQAELGRLVALPFAHRGLHGHGRVENSRAAFDAAMAGGYGIELDVQASRDGEAMVFHDAGLERLTAEAGELAGRASSDLQRVRLKSTDEGIPTLPEILLRVAGRVPLLIEIKDSQRRVAQLCRSVEVALQGYGGPAAIMSFNPEVGRWFALNAPHILRGLVVTEQGKKNWRGRLERLLAARRVGGDLLAYDIRDLPSRFADAQRSKGVKLLTWTCRSDAERERAAAHADQIIFEEP